MTDDDEKVKQFVSSNQGNNKDTDSESITQLSTQLEKLRESRDEERFVFVVVLALLFNVILIENVTSIGVALVVLIPEGVLLLLLAYKLGIDVIFGSVRNSVSIL